MKKKLFTFIIILQVVVLLFVVSYAWFSQKVEKNTVTGDEMQITTTEDLILQYKGETYTSLNLNKVLSKSFSFEQVSSTGLGTDKFYKIDYTNNLSAKPGKYVEATANVDYIELDLTLACASKAKRVYLDGANSGFFIADTEPDLQNDRSAIDNMRCSITFVDQDSVTRNIILSNVEYKENVIVESDVYDKQKDISSGNDSLLPALNGGKYMETFNVAEDSYQDYVAKTPTGLENATLFSDYDYNVSTGNLILFDLSPYQRKNLKLRVWLDGPACFEDADHKITDRKLSFQFRFASTVDLGVEISSKKVSPGMEIDTINNYLNNNAGKLTIENTASPFYVPYSSEFYSLKSNLITEEIGAGGVKIYRYRNGSDERIYEPTQINGKTYYVANSASRDKDKLYYDLDAKVAYAKYDDLQWKLQKETAVPLPNSGSNDRVTLATINPSTHKVVIGNGANGDTFNLVGYIPFAENKDIVVVNEMYIFADIVECANAKDVQIKNSMVVAGLYTDFFISSFYDSNSTIDVVIDGIITQVPFSDVSKIKWKVEVCPGYEINTIVNADPIIGSSTMGYIETNDDGTYKNIEIYTNYLANDKPILLTAVYVDGQGEHEVIRCMYYKNMN